MVNRFRPMSYCNHLQAGQASRPFTYGCWTNPPSPPLTILKIVEGEIPFSRF